MYVLTNKSGINYLRFIRLIYFYTGITKQDLGSTTADNQAAKEIVRAICAWTKVYK